MRNGRSEGYELASLLCRPVLEILSSNVFSKLPTYSLVESGDPNNADDPRNITDKLINKFVAHHKAKFMMMLQDLYGLGDQYALVNPDGSVVFPSPDTVKLEWDKQRPNRIMRATISTRYRGTQVQEVLTDTERILRIRDGGTTWIEIPYENLIGRIPLVHYANNRRSNEQMGRPEYASELALLAYYNNLLLKAISGSEVMGNPIPVIEELDDIQNAIATNRSQVDQDFYNLDGNLQDRDTVDFDTNGMMFTTGKFALKSPIRGFSEDIRAMIRSLFELFTVHQRIPEAVFGVAIEASKASTQTQMPPFVQFIEMKRAMLDGQGADTELDLPAEGGMFELLDIWLRYRRLTDPRVIVEPVKSRWESVEITDERLRFEKVIYGKGVNLIPDAESLDLLNLVPDANRSVVLAREELQGKVAAGDPSISGGGDLTTMINRAAHEQRGNAADDNDPDEPEITNKPKDPDGGKNVPMGEIME